MSKYVPWVVAGISSVLVACTGSGPHGGARGPLVDSLITPSYYISFRAPEGLTSNKLSVYIQDRRTRSGKVLDGQKVLAPCASKNEAPGCENLVGYSFHDGSLHYFVTDSGRLTVKQGDQTTLWERGYWQEEGGAGQ